MVSERNPRPPAPPNLHSAEFDENPELTEAFFARARPALEVLAELGVETASFGPAPRGRGRPKAERPKQSVKLRLDPEILDGFRAGGPGWQTRINDVLAAYLKRQDGAY